MVVIGTRGVISGRLPAVGQFAPFPSWSATFGPVLHRLAPRRGGDDGAGHPGAGPGRPGRHGAVGRHGADPEGARASAACRSGRGAWCACSAPSAPSGHRWWPVWPTWPWPCPTTPWPRGGGVPWSSMPAAPGCWARLFRATGLAPYAPAPAPDASTGDESADADPTPTPTLTPVLRHRADGEARRSWPPSPWIDRRRGVVALGLLEAVARLLRAGRRHRRPPGRLAVASPPGVRGMAGTLRALRLAVASTVVAALICLPWLIGVLSAGRGAVSVFGTPLPASSALVGVAAAVRRRAHRCLGPRPGGSRWLPWSPWSWLAAGGSAGRPGSGPSPWSSGWRPGSSAGDGREAGHRPPGPARTGGGGHGRRHRARRRRLRGGPAAADFGWRQLLTVVAAGGPVLGAVPTLVSALPGRWDLPVQRLQPVGDLDGGQDRRAGPSGCCGSGTPGPSTRARGVRRRAGLRHLGGRAPDARWLWNAAEPGPAARLASAVDLARTEPHRPVGQLLAPAGVRYVVVLTSLAPEIPGSRRPSRYPVPADLLPALDRQLDSRPWSPAPGSPSTRTPTGSRPGWRWRRSCAGRRLRRSPIRRT